MSLTDDWKAGKLQEGWYYVRNAFLRNGAIGKLESKDNCLYCPHSYVFTNNGDTKIIAHVPSYEELQRLKEEKRQLQVALNKIYNLNPRYYGIDIFMKCQEIAKKALTRINAAISESEE